MLIVGLRWAVVARKRQRHRIELIRRKQQPALKKGRPKNNDDQERENQDTDRVFEAG